MKRLVLVAALVFGPASVAHGDGCPASTCGSSVSSEALPGSHVVALRPVGVAGPLVGYSTTTGKRIFSLPPGRLSGDSKTFVSWHFRGGDTMLRRYETRAGRAIASWRISGHAMIGSVSAHGDWVALYYLGGKRSRLALFDTRTGRVAQRVAWRGAYEAEAVSPNGRMLFLIHHTPDGYDLRTYDVLRHRLRATRLADPGEKMSGTPVNAISSHDGRWLLTLYVESSGGSFVHALDLRSGIAHCIDLPWRVTQLAGPGTASLAVSPDNTHLYLANPMLGSVAVVDLHRLRVAHVVHFTAVRNTNSFFGSAAAVSPRGRMLAFGALDRVWTYDTAYGIVRGPVRAATRLIRTTTFPTTVTAVAFTPRGRRLTVLNSDSSRAVFDGASRRRLGLR